MDEAKDRKTMTILKIPKQEYTAEFKELTVKRVKDGQPIAAVARDLGLVEQTLRNWVKAFEAFKLNSRPRKIHGFHSPLEVYAELLVKAQHLDSNSIV